MSRMSTGGGEASSEDLSPPPKSPVIPSHLSKSEPQRQVSYPHLPNAAGSAILGGEKLTSQSPGPAAGRAKSSVPRKPRKKKDPTQSLAVAKDGNGTSSGAPEVKEKKTRKPRSTSGASTVPRKKLKVEDADFQDGKKANVLQDSHHPNLSMPMGSPTAQTQPTFAANARGHTLGRPPQSGKSEAIQNAHLIHAYLPSNQQPVPRPASAGQHYDPIRSSTRDNAQPPQNPFSPPQAVSHRPGNRASESPSISSLIDPPGTAASPYAYAKSSASSTSTPLPNVRNGPAERSPNSTRFPTSAPTNYSPNDLSRLKVTGEPTHAMNTSLSPDTINMDIDYAPVAPKSAVPTNIKPSLAAKGFTTSTSASTPNTSTAPSPKPHRAKEKDKLPPLPSGNGLLSSALFGGPADSNEVPQKAPTVILEVALSSDEPKIINFTRMAESRYGVDALYPRIAANRARLARVAAAGAALENASKEKSGRGAATASGDEDMSLDNSDGDGAENSNVEMGGMGGTGTDDAAKDGSGKPPARKRRVKKDLYDRDDPFIDDSEMAWEENAAASKDGFFVYSGPLVPEGEKVTVERYVISMHIALKFIICFSKCTTRSAYDVTYRKHANRPSWPTQYLNPVLNTINNHTLTWTLEPTEPLGNLEVPELAVVVVEPRKPMARPHPLVAVRVVANPQYENPV